MLKILILISACITFTTQNGPQLKVDQGTLRGTFKKSLDGKDYSSFTGIPYAKPPIGELRFNEPLPAGHWKGILDATKEHAVCPQINLVMGDYNIFGEEDCLFLNVHTPQLEPSSTQPLLPVMFYIHGGSWTSGSANMFTAGILLNHDIVLVTINYRLSSLGFLSTGDNVVPGNNGLKDQNLALKWVKKNIIYFGGDPENIIIFGQSAGAISTHFHVLSPLSKDLINGAIIQSGSALAPWALNSQETVHNVVTKLAIFTNCPYPSSQVLVDCLRMIPAHELIALELKNGRFIL